MIDAETVTLILTTLLGSWAVGFGMGKAVAYVNALRNVA